MVIEMQMKIFSETARRTTLTQARSEYPNPTAIISKVVLVIVLVFHVVSVSPLVVKIDVCIAI